MLIKRICYETEKFRVLFNTDSYIPDYELKSFDNWLIELCKDLPNSSSNTRTYFYNDGYYNIQVIFDIERFDKK